jgi:serine/threonine protein kinase
MRKHNSDSSSDDSSSEDEYASHQRRRPSNVWEAGNFLVRSSELHYDKKIASGNYGTVYKGKCRGYQVAIKVLHNQHLNEQKIEELKREVEIMSSLRHPCILLLMGVCTEKDNLALVMEYIEGRDLESVIHDAGVTLTVPQQLHIAKGIAQGMNWLHCLKPEPIIHRDLKPPNILITKEFDVKVCDFGLSCVKEKFDPKAPPKDKAVGTPVWMAPEILCGMPASEKSDVYAYGLILWELFTRTDRPFAHVTSFAEFCDDVIDRHVRPTLTDNVPADVQRLIRKCWAPNMNERPLFGAIIDMVDDLLVDTYIKDPAAREVWKKLKQREGVSHYPDFVSWENFIAVLCEALDLKSDSSFSFTPNSPAYKCVQAILSEADKDLTSSSKEKKLVVTCESFGRFVEVFGPMQDRILQNFNELCKKGCFHGSIDAKEAERRLLNDRPGAYLIRLSSKDNCITITKKVKHGYNHQRCFRNERGYNIMFNSKVHSFSLLTEFLDSPLAKSKKDGLYLKVPCFNGSPFAGFHGLGLDTPSDVCYIGLDLVRQGIAETRAKDKEGHKSSSSGGGSKSRSHSASKSKAKE